ncbi:MAG: sulfatase [Planctomycetes bacterium]|nr:sulfatase [Planctomycetota bacterium]
MALLVAQGAARAQAANPPNILFVFSDDHAPSAIGAYGGRYAGLNPTPAIDRLAREGMLFRASFCTNSICGPSRAVILSGLHSHKNGFRGNGDRFDGDQETFPKLLQHAGYETAMIGKWHLGSDPQGFDHWEVLPGQGDYYNPEFLTPQGRVRREGYVTDLVTDSAIHWLEQERDPGKPFLLMCQHKAPHRTWMPAPRHFTLYDDVVIPEPETLFDDHRDDASPARFQEMEVDRHMNLVYDLKVEPDESFDPKAGTANDGSGFRNLRTMTAAQRKAWDAYYHPISQTFHGAKLEGRDLVRWKYQRYLKDYLRCVRGVDESVQRLTNWLRENGLEENTVVIYSSDQGFFLGDHGWFDKRWMYEESLSMPLIVKWPKHAQGGSVNGDLVQNLDYAPTFLEMAGVPVPARMQGRSLVPLLTGKRPYDWRGAIYYHYFGFPDIHSVARHYGIRTDRYKLIRYYQFDEWELFDLATDPDERTNLYGEPRRAATVAELQRELEALRTQYEDDSDVRVMPPAWRARFRR